MVLFNTSREQHTSPNFWFFCMISGGSDSSSSLSGGELWPSGREGASAPPGENERLAAGMGSTAAMAPTGGAASTGSSEARPGTETIGEEDSWVSVPAASCWDSSAQRFLVVGISATSTRKQYACNPIASDWTI
jgi:hypothetical protein